EPCLAIRYSVQPTIHHNSHDGRTILRAGSNRLTPAGAINCRHWTRRRRNMVSTRDEASGLFRREPSQPARLPAGYRVRGTILRLPCPSTATSPAPPHPISTNLSPRRNSISRWSLALLILVRIPRLNLNLK